MSASSNVRGVESRPGDPVITPAMVAEHGITEFEYERLIVMLGRTPTFTELGVVSALWSEHCSYKHSRPMLKTLPTKAPWVLQGPGENAGVISVGDGWAVAFKIESHNHPSAVEPSGRRYGRRWDSPRCLHDGCASDRVAELAAFRPSVIEPCTLVVCRRSEGHRRLR